MEFTSRQLRGFLSVAQYRSFSRAAETLFITPSGLSVLIRELETQLGFRLFDRTTRHVALTSSGKEMLAVARESLAKLDAAASQIGRSAGQASQWLSLGAPPLIAANMVTQPSAKPPHSIVRREVACHPAIDSCRKARHRAGHLPSYSWYPTYAVSSFSFGSYSPR